MNQIEQRLRLVVISPRPRAFKAHHAEERIVAIARAQIVFGYSEPAQIFGGKIDPAQRRILAANRSWYGGWYGHCEDHDHLAGPSD
jgi:hypothetical protein